MPRINSEYPWTSINKQRFAWSIPGQRDGRYSHSLERGLAILESFTPERPLRGNADLAEELGMSRSTTHRYLSTLAALGYLEQNAYREYSLALRVTELGMSAMNATGLREHAHPYLEELRRRSTYTTSLAVLDGPEILYIDRVPTIRRGASKSDLGLQPGSRLPAYCTALGKLLLAYLPETWQRAELLAEMDLATRGPNTITSPRALLDELDAIREEGLAVNDEELTAGLHAIAAPVRDEAREVVAAVNLAADTTIIPLADLVDALGPPLIATADRVSARLGYRLTR